MEQNSYSQLKQSVF